MNNDTIILNPKKFQSIFSKAMYAVCTDDDIFYSIGEVGDMDENGNENYQVGFVPFENNADYMNYDEARVITDEMLNNDVEYSKSTKAFRFTVGDFPSFYLFGVMSVPGV